MSRLFMYLGSVWLGFWLAVLSKHGFEVFDAYYWAALAGTLALHFISLELKK